MDEVWLPVPGFRGFYWVSNLGNVRSRTRTLVHASPEKYPHVSLSKDGVIETHRVHLLVLRAFCGEKPFPEAQAAHNDGDPSNSHLTNLRWASPVENQADVDRHGRRCRGERVHGAVLTEDLVREIRQRLPLGEKNRVVASDYGVSVSTIHLIRHNKIWRHV